MSATREDKEAWEAQYKLTEAGKRFFEAIELVNEAKVHYEHVGSTTMTHECGVLQTHFMALTEELGVANRKALEEAS